MLSEMERKEMLEASRSDSLREDMRRIREAGKYSFVRDGEVDLDAYMAFLAAFNEFIGHRPKPFKEGNFKL